MAEDPSQNVPEPAARVSDPGPSAVDPRDAELSELRAFRDQASPIFERLKPFEEDVKYLLEDEDYATAQREMRKSYFTQREQRRKEAEPELDEPSQRLLKAIEKTLEPRLKFVDELAKRETPEYQQEQAAKSASDEFAKQNVEYAQRLMAEEKLDQDDIFTLSAFANALHERTKAEGKPRFVGLEEAYKKMRGTGAAKPAPAPRSLRSHSAAPGVPGNSKPAEPDRKELARPGGLTSHMLSVLQRAK